MRRRTAGAFGLILATSVGFLAGALVTGIVMSGPMGTARSSTAAGPTDDCGESAMAASPDPPERAVAVVRPPPPPESAPPRIGADPIADLRDRQLLLPVQGVERDALRGSFTEKRGSNRLHEAIDILAPRNTPVLAVEDGTIARMFSSVAGGTTLYQFDPTSMYVYYYAHLERYAHGLREGGAVKRGQVVGYVGTSGNAPDGTPHLHFSIFKMTEKKQWWQGSPIDPFEVLRWQGGQHDTPIPADTARRRPGGADIGGLRGDNRQQDPG